MNNSNPERIGRLMLPRHFNGAVRFSPFARTASRRGITMPLIAMALVALLGCMALSLDIGQLCVAAQTAQNVADAAAFAGAPLLIDQTSAVTAACQAVAANNADGGEFQVTCNYVPDSSDSDICYYGANATVPGYGVLGPYAQALTVACHVNVNFTFARVLGLTHQVVTRHATAVRGPLGGAPISPMWISHPTPYNYGDYQNLLMASGPCDADTPGNFGWLQLPSGVSATWSEVISGMPLSEADMEAMFTAPGYTVWGNTGLAVGTWTSYLQTRIDTANAEFPGETWDNCSKDNPRVIIVPLVTYVTGTGNNAQFTVDKFGAFWIDDINASANPKSIDGRFIRYTMPGAGLDPLADDVGLFTYQLAG